jgi:hypothetical protein
MNVGRRPQMNDALGALDSAIAQVNQLRAFLRKKSNPQVRSSEERSPIKALALAWFNNQGPTISTIAETSDLQELDDLYKGILAAADLSSLRSKYDSLLKEVKASLISVRSKSLSAGARNTAAGDRPPDFAPLISDPAMQTILNGRWSECVLSLQAGAPMAATVMMGGLLEALLLGRIHRESNKAPIFQAASAPSDKTGKTKPLNEWTLKNYIDVSHDLGWISVSAKDVGEVLRDYRNYIHPFKQLSHGINLTTEDASLFWEISKNISRQVIKSVPKQNRTVIR